MAWFVLILAGFLEIFGVAMMNVFLVKRNWQTMTLLILGFLLSFVLLGYSLRFIPMATGYAIWTGMGISGGALIGMLLFNESKDWKRIVFIVIIFCSVIGLKLIT